MAGPGVFHVEFGINETALTRALEKRDYKTAESLIRNNINPSFLDEGCYQRTPLYITLCGLDEEEHVAPRNFYVAKLLAAQGASVNFRVPTTYFGSEYMGPGHSALELLIKFYNSLTRSKSHPISGIREENWNPYYHLVIGLDNLIVRTYSQLLEQTEKLIYIFLCHGGDTNLTDEFRMTLLHRSLVLSTEVSLIEMICEAGPNVNAVDMRGNTPLGALCDSFPFGMEQYIENQECLNMDGRIHFLELMLQQPDIKLDVQNKLHRTALFNCMVRQEQDSTRMLLEKGADTTLKGRLFSLGKTICASPLFAALSRAKLQEGFQVEVQDPVLQRLWHHVDSGFFSKPEIVTELEEYIDEFLPDMTILKLYGPQLIHLMFGGTTSTLAQLSTRAVFHRCVQANSALAAQCDMVHSYAKLTVDDADDAAYAHQGETQVSSRPSHGFDILVQTLGIPMDFVIRFQIELLRLHLCRFFSRTTWIRSSDNYLAGYNSESDSDASTTDNDSDIEYW